MRLDQTCVHNKKWTLSSATLRVAICSNTGILGNDENHTDSATSIGFIRTTSFSHCEITSCSPRVIAWLQFPLACTMFFPLGSSSMVTFPIPPNRSEKTELFPAKQWLVYPPTQWSIRIPSSRSACVEIISIIDQLASRSSVVHQSQPCDVTFHGLDNIADGFKRQFFADCSWSVKGMVVFGY